MIANIQNPYRFVSGGVCLDADATAFVAAAGITDNTEKEAICTLVTSLKSDSLWARMDAIYPFVGGTASAHKFNLINPLDTDGAYRLTFNGTITHSSTGALPNGANGYADTHFSPTSLDKDDNHLSYFSNTASTLAAVDFGLYDTDGGNYYDYISHLFVATRVYMAMTTDAPRFVTSTQTEGFLICSRESSTISKATENGVVILNLNSISSKVYAGSKNLFLFARNSIGTASNFTDRECQFASVGGGMTAAEAVTFNTIVHDFQTNLGR